MSLLWQIIRKCLSSPRRVAAVDDRREYTCGQLLGGALFVAERIDALTSRPNVGILLPTSGGFPLALLGTWLAGKTAVPFNYLLTPEELAYVITDSQVDTILTAGPMLSFLGGSAAIPAGVHLVKLEEMDFTGVPPLRWPPRPDPDDTAVILYTSGTSGRPKGVMLTHRNLEANARGAIEHARITSADTFLGVLPQFHSFGLTGLTLLPLLVGAKVVYAARFMPKRVVELIRTHRPEVVMAVPSMYNALLTVKDATADNFRSIRFPVSGGEPLPDALYQEYLQRFNLRLLEGYGLTETAPVLTWSTPEANKTHSVGTALPGVSILIVDEHDRPLPTGQDGEILAAGPNLMKGYYRLPEMTAQVMTKIDVPAGHVFPGEAGRDPRAAKWRARWFRTGDLGKLDEEGFLYITGRKKEMLKVAGEMVIPREIEEVLSHHASVRDAAVIGKSDGMRGEVPIAFVEIHEGQAFDDKALRDWCRERLAPFKLPREFRPIDKLPRNPTGKIMRRQLKAD